MLKAAYGPQCESNLRTIYMEIYPNDDFNAQYSMNLKFNVINMNAIIKKHIHIIQPLMQLQVLLEAYCWRQIKFLLFRKI